MQDLAQLGVRLRFSNACGGMAPQSKAPAGRTVAARAANLARTFPIFIVDEKLQAVLKSREVVKDTVYVKPLCA